MTVVSFTDRTRFSPEKMQKNTLFETDRCFCDLYCFEPGQEQKGHTHHGSDKMYLVLEGEGTFDVGSESKVLSQGMATIAAAGQPHGVRNHTDRRLIVLVFMAPKP